MSRYKLYTGYWPRVGLKSARYSIRKDHGEWRVSIEILHDYQKSIVFTDGMHLDIVERVNDVKLSFKDKEGGPFYINEFHHLIVPIPKDGTSHYFFGEKIGTVDFVFSLGLDKKYTPKQIGFDGTPLKPGYRWVGTCAGIRYVLAADGADIYYENVIFSNENPPQVIADTTRKYYLKKVCSNLAAAEQNIQMVRNVKGNSGGTFFVNENLAVFAPVREEDEDIWNFVYCGQLNLEGWFPVPDV